jgi:hypothetical protein
MSDMKPDASPADANLDDNGNPEINAVSDILSPLQIANDTSIFFFTSSFFVGLKFLFPVSLQSCHYICSQWFCTNFFFVVSDVVGLFGCIIWVKMMSVKVARLKTTTTKPLIPNKLG